MMSETPAAFAAWYAAGTPYTPSRSVSAKAGSFKAAARATRSSGAEAPSRNE